MINQGLLFYTFDTEKFVHDKTMNISHKQVELLSG